MSVRPVRLWCAMSVGALALAACQSSGAPAQQTPPVVALAPVGSATAPVDAAPSPVAEPTPEAKPGPDVLIGTLLATKGKQVELGGHLLSIDALRKRFGDDWRAQVLGRRLRVIGTKTVYACDPREQCLIQGVIPMLQDVTAIDLCESSRPLPAASGPAVACPPCEADVRDCLAQCERQSDECSASSGSKGGGMGAGQCGCARATCEQGCREHAEALFQCS
jgi:hypothetical protein